MHLMPARQLRQEIRVFIVGMRRHHEHAPTHRHATQQLVQRRRAALLP